MWAGFGFSWPSNYHPWDHARGMSWLVFLLSEPYVIYRLMCHLYIPSLLQAHVFQSPSGCAAFLANYNSNSYAKVVFNNEHYSLPPWSISILPDCKNVVFNSATVSLTYAYFLILHFPPFVPKQLYDTWFIWLNCFISAGWCSDISDANVGRRGLLNDVGEVWWGGWFSGSCSIAHHNWFAWAA